MENDLIRRSDALAAFAESTSAMPEKHGRRRIEEIPAVDAVEVVRCRECVAHKECHVEDIFILARLDETKRYCGGGKRREDGDVDGRS